MMEMEYTVTTFDIVKHILVLLIYIAGIGGLIYSARHILTGKEGRLRQGISVAWIIATILAVIDTIYMTWNIIPYDADAAWLILAAAAILALALAMLYENRAG